MMTYTRNAVRIVGVAIFLVLMFVNVDVMGPRGVHATASSPVAECDLCLGNQQYCATYCFPNENDDGYHCYDENSNEDPIVIEE